MSTHGSSAIIDLVRKIEQMNREGGDFYFDFEYVSVKSMDR